MSLLLLVALTVSVTVLLLYDVRRPEYDLGYTLEVWCGAVHLYLM
jgi:hypothetical protein